MAIIEHSTRRRTSLTAPSPPARTVAPHRLDALRPTASSAASSPMRCAGSACARSRGSRSTSSRWARACGSIRTAMSARSGCCSRRNISIPSGARDPGLAPARRFPLHRHRRQYRRVFAVRRGQGRAERAHRRGRAPARGLRAAGLQHRAEPVRHGQGGGLRARRQAGRTDALPRPRPIAANRACASCAPAPAARCACRR